MSSSFFKNIAVTYWTAQIYNDTQTDMRCEIDEEFTSPLVDAASNYVCSVERLELSGNNIFVYSADLDPDADFNVAISNTRYCSIIYFLSDDYTPAGSHYIMSIYGSYSSLGSLIDAMNLWKLVPDENNRTLEEIDFSITSDGKIRMVVNSNDSVTKWNDIVLQFSSGTLASIFGLPQTPTAVTYPTPSDWFNAFSDWTPYGILAFQTKSSRVDCGIIPTMIQLRSTLPFESDQVSSTKTNIVTDFNIVSNSGSDFVLSSSGTTGNNDIPFDRLVANGLSLGNSSMIIYTPAERRWLNFSAPIPIYNIRLWVELIYNDPDQVIVYQIPPGGKFSIKLGLYLRET